MSESNKDEALRCLGLAGRHRDNGNLGAEIYSIYVEPLCLIIRVQTPLANSARNPYRYTKLKMLWHFYKSLNVFLLQHHHLIQFLKAFLHRPPPLLAMMRPRLRVTTLNEWQLSDGYVPARPRSTMKFWDFGESAQKPISKKLTERCIPFL